MRESHLRTAAFMALCAMIGLNAGCNPVGGGTGTGSSSSGGSSTGGSGGGPGGSTGGGPGGGQGGGPGGSTGGGSGGHQGGGPGGSTGGGSGGGPGGGSGGGQGGGSGGGTVGGLPPGTVPLTELAAASGTQAQGLTYQGFSGGLYPNASNADSGNHWSEGLSRAAAIQPLDRSGNVDNAAGRIVLLSLGMSNANLEFGLQNGQAGPGLIYLASHDPTVSSKVTIVNGAIGGADARIWATSDPNNPQDRVWSHVSAQLQTAGVSAEQVQVIWLKNADAGPRTSLPGSSATPADARNLESFHAQTIRKLLAPANGQSHLFPNLQMVFVSSRIYAGYATSSLNPEPYAYESAFAVKWLIEAQIDEEAGGAIDSFAGDLRYSTGTAPWIAWGPYTWANGTTPRAELLDWEKVWVTNWAVNASPTLDPLSQKPMQFPECAPGAQGNPNGGLVWDALDLRTQGAPGIQPGQPVDGTHPSQRGVGKVGSMLLEFFKNEPETAPWFKR